MLLAFNFLALDESIALSSTSSSNLFNIALTLWRAVLLLSLKVGAGATGSATTGGTSSTTGATGVSTGQTEAELNLKVGLLLQKELESRGYSVIMTRTTNDVNISNSQRAEIANNANADVFVRIHADSVDTSSVVRNVNIMPNSK